MSQPYEYSPLQTSDSIRVISLLPSRDQGTSLQCKLIEVSLLSPPKFEALSYCWGSPLRDRPVFCDGRQLLVTVNCEAALYVLRNRKKRRMLWIDSICINQSSLHERNQQVKLMMQVYSSAKCVLVWLGPGDPDSDLAFHHLSKTARRLNRTRFIPFLSYQKCANSAAKSTAKRIKKENELHFGKRYKNQSILDCLYQNPWFTRVWTIQEVAMARRAKIICGDRELSWYNFDRAQLPLVYYAETSKAAEDIVISMDVYSHADLCLFFRRMVRDSPKEGQVFPEKELHRNLMTLFQKNATDPKDKAFALYGLFHAVGITLPDPDYSKSTGVVYRELSKAVMLRCRNLNLLLLASGAQTVPDLPSWAPDWTRKSQKTDFIIAGDIYFDFPVTRSSIGSFRFSEDSSQLIARGVIIDSIACCQGPAPGSFPGQTVKNTYNSVCILKRWVSMLKSMNSEVYVDGTSLLNAFVNLIPQIVREEQLKDIPDTILFSVVVTKWVEILMDMSTCCSHITSPARPDKISKALRQAWVMLDSKQGELDSDHLGHLDQIFESPEFITMSHLIQHADVFALHGCLTVLASRFLFFTTQDGYIGKGDNNIQIGDVVAVFPGFEYSVFLRPTQEHYLFVGLGSIQHRLGPINWLSDNSKMVDITIL